ncbi:MAG: hypothetical protein D8M57_13645 [Candidatus Scalindua sp. AMX11]|nr:MAG: hypothetical protein DWQ00_06155 [Candidatus Scalindua sp.]NOG83431.1 hypothetical protein [Planctomycetota bacterium]RZV75058.1 MAG: hypothetical protein EX341_12680 [Candidatus Scalindua sp. SCAELEC01]TDE64319.1 MAG: hypothetical protein D8M57_13645 [Candidatus Scalindua sp. AMX11]
MVNQFSRSILSLILISSILCSFGFAEPCTVKTQSNHQQGGTSIDSHQDGFSSAIVADYRNHLKLPFSPLLVEKWEEVEDPEKKQRILLGYCSARDQFTHQINTLPSLSAPLSICDRYHPACYLLFEVFLL